MALQGCTCFNAVRWLLQIATCNANDGEASLAGKSRDSEGRSQSHGGHLVITSLTQMHSTSAS
jgi:hypothetical protein